MPSLHRRTITLAVVAAAAIAAVAPAGAQASHWGDNAEVVFYASPSHPAPGWILPADDASSKDSG